MMKKRLMAAILALLLCVALLPVGALAEEEEDDAPDAPILNGLEIRQDGWQLWVDADITTPLTVTNLMNILSMFYATDYFSGIQMEISVDGGAWKELTLTSLEIVDPWNGHWRTDAISGLRANSVVQARVRYWGKKNDGSSMLGKWSEVLTVNGASGGGEEPAVPTASPQPTEVPGGGEEPAYIVSDWARSEVEKAAELGLIPDELLNADLTQSIDRREFAAVSVKVFEALSGAAAEAAGESPFTDTADPEVLKAVEIGITNGMSADTFEPDTKLNRETASTMLARAFKRVKLEGWTLAEDGSYAEAFHALFDMPETFVDDADISSWALDSVYFMAANGVLRGREDGSFDPKSLATRQEALLIAVRMVQNLK